MPAKRSLITLLWVCVASVCFSGCASHVAQRPAPLPVFFDPASEASARVVGWQRLNYLWPMTFTGDAKGRARLRIIEDDFSSNRDGSPGFPSTDRYYVKVELLVADKRIVLTAKGNTVPDRPYIRDDAVEAAVWDIARQARKYL